MKELQEKLKSLRPLNKTELKRLQQEFIIENTYNSNAIEGNTLTLRETALIIQEGLTISEKPLKEHLEVIGYKEAFDYILEITNEPLTDRIIKDIHSLVLINDTKNKGKYRQVPVKILGSEHKTANVEDIENRIKNLLENYNKMLNDDIIKAICYLHLEFESIHPFIDGNGRTGRLLLNLELIKNGYLPVNIKFTDRLKYYKAFDEYHNGNIDYFYNMIVEYETQELKRYIDLLS